MTDEDVPKKGYNVIVANNFLTPGRIELQRFQETCKELFKKRAGVATVACEYSFTRCLNISL